MRYQDVIRLVLAVLFFVGAGANAYMVLRVPEVYESFGDLSFLPLYREAWRGLILRRLGLWMGVVIAFEIIAGALLLLPDPYARAGLMLAASYTLALVPFWWGGGGVLNVLLALLIIWLLRFNYPASLIALLWRR